MADKKKNGNIVDLTAEDDEGSGQQSDGKKAKAAKPKKEPKPAKPVPEKKSAGKDKAGEKTDGNKKKGGAGRVIFILILLVLVGGFVYEEIVYNMLGVRDTFIAAVVKLDPNYQTLESKAAALEEWEIQLDKREKTIESKETQQSDRQMELDRREEEIAERENTLTPIYRQPLSERDLEDMESLSKTYSSMDAATAANIMGRLYDVQDMAAIIYYMTERSAAAVLAAMDVRLAAEITDILLHK